MFGLTWAKIDLACPIRVPMTVFMRYKIPYPVNQCAIVIIVTAAEIIDYPVISYAFDLSLSAARSTTAARTSVTTATGR